MEDSDHRRAALPRAPCRPRGPTPCAAPPPPACGQSLELGKGTVGAAHLEAQLVASSGGKAPVAPQQHDAASFEAKLFSEAQQRQQRAFG